MRMGQRDLAPKDLIATNLKLKSAFTQTDTLRWEIRSTLTSDEEAAPAKTEESSSSATEEEDVIPPFPERLPNGIWELQNDEQHM